MRTNSTTLADLADASPLTLDELRGLNVARQLPQRLAAMTPRQRVGAAAVLALATGRDLSTLLDLFTRLVVEAGPQAPPPATPAAISGRSLVSSETDPKLVYIVADNGASCTCPSFKFRRDCKHARRARETWAARVRSVLGRRIGAAQAAAMALPFAA